MTARQPAHEGAKSSPKDGKHEVSIDKMVVQTSPVDAVRGFLILGRWGIERNMLISMT